MKRSLNLFVADILNSINNIESFSINLSEQKFLNDELHQSAIVRQIEIIGEAVKNIPDSFRDKYPEVPWKKAAGMRDLIIHTYFSVDLDTVWRVIKTDIPILKVQIQKIMEDLDAKNKTHLKNGKK